MNEQSTDHAAVRIPPPVLVVLILVVGYLLAQQWPILLGFEIGRPARYWVGGTIAAGFLLGIGAWADVSFRRTGQDPKPWKTTPEIITGGPYRFSRNPMYLAMLLVCVGVSIMLWNVWVLILTPVCAGLLYATAIRHEESYLENKFGADYLAYKERVRRWL